MHDVWLIGDGEDWYYHLQDSIENGEFEMEKLTIEQCEEVIAGLKATRNQKRDEIASLTKDWNDLDSLQEAYMRWPLKDLLEEAEKYGAEIVTRKSGIITNLTIVHEERYARQIDAAEHIIQSCSEEIIEFGRDLARLKAQQVEIS